VASRTLSGVPLSLLLKKIKKQRFLTRELLYTHKDEYSYEHLAKCYSLIHEIENLLSNLERCDHKARIYKSVFQCIPAFSRVARKACENCYAPIDSSLRIT